MIKKLLLCLGLMLTIFLCSSFISTSVNLSQPITPEIFFQSLATELNIKTSHLQDSYPYCFPSIAYLVKQDYITPRQAYLLSNDECTTTSLIDRAFLFVEYFDRPLSKGEYSSITERVAKETGLVDKNFDFSDELDYEEAEAIIDKLVNERFKRISYSKVEAKVEYTIDNFYGMSESLRKTLKYINMLPDSCIKDFNNKGYVLKITDDIARYHPHKRKNVTAFINLTTREVCVKNGYESDILHEFGHLMIRDITGYYSICNYIYKTEGQKALSIKGFRRHDSGEEYCADAFQIYVAHMNDAEYMKEFEEKCPLTYNFIKNIIT